MPKSAYFVSHNRAIRVANDNGPAPLNVHHLPPLVQVGVRRNGLSEMILFVEEGVVEFMIGGASGFVTSGGFVRVPADTQFAYRNAGDETAKLVTRAAGPSKASDTAA
jgi:mannose-6-phosphate isomerase-like protein (cupin superfamily)